MERFVVFENMMGTGWQFVTSVATVEAARKEMRRIDSELGRDKSRAFDLVLNRTVKY